MISSRSAISHVQCQADAAAAEIAPPKLESAVCFDFVPLLTALQAGEYREADFITRAALIKIAGDAAVARGFVYWTEASKLPMEDVRVQAGVESPHGRDLCFTRTHVEDRTLDDSLLSVPRAARC